MKVMIVDDERDVQFLFEQRFRKELRSGILEFLFACSGAEALQFLEADAPAAVTLVLSDINMPGMSGLELLKVLKERNRQIKVYITTAYGNESYYRQAQEYGCDYFFTKPIDFKALRSRMLA